MVFDIRNILGHPARGRLKGNPTIPAFVHKSTIMHTRAVVPDFQSVGTCAGNNTQTKETNTRMHNGPTSKQTQKQPASKRE